MLPKLLLFLICLTSSSWAMEGSRSEMRKPNRTLPTQTEKSVPPAPEQKPPAPTYQAPPSPPPVIKPRTEEDAKPANPSAGAESGTHITYYGHAFIYLTSKSGVRVALNPFTEGSVDYTFPKNLPADIVLISSESADHAGGQHFFGVPQIFRSLTGLGANRANGIPFRGIETYRDDREGRELGKNAVYVVEMDNMRFCHLGTLGHPLSSRQADAIGRVDVLFLPVGLTALANRDIWKMVEQLQPKWIVPITYQTDKNKKVSLRPLSEFEMETHPVMNSLSNEYTFNAQSLPAIPTILLIKNP